MRGQINPWKSEVRLQNVQLTAASADRLVVSGLQHSLKEQVNLLCGSNAEFLNVLPGGVYSILLALNGLKEGKR